LPARPILCISADFLCALCAVPLLILDGLRTVIVVFQETPKKTPVSQKALREIPPPCRFHQWADKKPNDLPQQVNSDFHSTRDAFEAGVPPEEKMKLSTPLTIVSRALPRPLACLLAVLAVSALGFAQAGDFLPSPVRVVSTVPSNGDVNPYGVAFVPTGFPAGTLPPGDILVSNFNNNNNLQGLGTTIMHIPQSGAASVFYQSASPHTGLSTALSITRSGYVLAGSFPTYDGTCATAQPGALLVLTGSGQLAATISGSEIDGPWGMTLNDTGNKVQAFVANALNGTITRLDFQMSKGVFTLHDSVEVASGYRFQCDPASLVDAPTGLVYDTGTATLYVASTLDNAVFAISDANTLTSSAGTGTVVYQDATHLHGALAMAMAPNSHLLVTNNDVINANPSLPSEIVEFTKLGQFVKEVSVDSNPGGAFGLQVHDFTGDITQLAAVDDNTNSLIIWTLTTD
jgi:DNA-binding beta-propeller fold protein YncE